MAKRVKFGVKVVNNKIWSFVSPSCGDPSETPVNQVFRWILEQLNLGNWQCSKDAHDHVTSLIVGAAAAEDVGGTTTEEVATNVRERLRCLNLAGIFARGREAGLGPGDIELADLQKRSG